MSDRRLRDPTRPIQQRLAATERRLRGQQLRSNPGAVRSITAASYVQPVEMGVPTTVLDIVVASGRWTVIAQVDVHFPAPAGQIDLYVSIVFTDPSSGLELTEGVSNCPTRQFRITPSAEVVAPMTLSGDVILENRANVALAVYDGLENAWVAHRARLQLTPC